MKALLCLLTTGLVARFNLVSGLNLTIGNGVLHRRSYFYVGGSYTPTSGSSNESDVVVSSGQMYVEHLVPLTVTHKLPIVIIPGNGEVLYVSCSERRYS